MAKLSLAAVAFLLFLVATEATVRTTVIVDEEDASNQRGSGDCSEQLEQQQNLWHCQQYMQQQARQRGGRGRDELAIIDQAGQEHFEDCCQQLRQLDRQCTCQGLEQVLRQLERGQVREQDLQSVRRLAENLPGDCRTEPSSCQFRHRSAWL